MPVGRIQLGALLQPLDQAGHPPLLVTHGVAHDLGGMGREYQPQIEIAQQVFDLGRGHIQGPQPLKQLPEGGRFRLAGQRRQERIFIYRFAVGLQAVQVAVFLDVLFEDVDQLEVERKGAGGGDGLGQIHLPDQLHDGAGVDGAIAIPLGFAQLLQPQQPLGLAGGAFAVQHCLPEILHQFKTLSQQPGNPWRCFGGDG